MRARDDQLGVSRLQPLEDVPAQAVTDQEGVVFPGGNSVDAPLDFDAPGAGVVMQALVEKLHVHQVRRLRRDDADFAHRNFTGDDLEKALRHNCPASQ